MKECMICGLSSAKFVEEREGGKGKYRCIDCGGEFVDPTPFATLSDEEAKLASEIASALGKYDFAEEVANDRKFAEGRASRIRDQMATALESGAFEGKPVEDRIEALYERLSAKLYPESHAVS